jgi:hypothetical protein
MAGIPGYAGGLHPVFSQRRRVRREICGAIKLSPYELLGDLGALAREKTIYSRQVAKYAKVFGVRTK